MTERLQVREIDDDEGQRLVRIIRRGSGSVVTWRRAQMVLLSAQGMNVAAIAKVAFTSEDRVRDVIRNFNADGFGSLYPKYKGGHPPKLALGQRRDGAHEQAAALLARDPAAHAALDDPGRRGPPAAGGRPRGSRPPRWPTGPPPTPLGAPRGVAWLLDSLRRAGADDQATTGVGRLPAVGLFRLFLEQNGLADQFRFGRGDRRYPGRATGLGSPGLMACFRTAETARRRYASAYR